MNNDPAPDGVSRREDAEQAVAEYEKYSHIRCLRLWGNREDAKDMAQELLIEALESWREKGVPENPGAWLNVVSRRRAIDYWRKRQHEPEFSDEDLDLLEASSADSSSTQLVVDGNQFLTRVRRMLPERTAKNFDLYLEKGFYEWDHDQIALKLNVSPGRPGAGSTGCARRCATGSRCCA
jgi:RNA polymerase sigma factor (sigma-70 family)